MPRTRALRRQRRWGAPIRFLGLASLRTPLRRWGASPALLQARLSCLRRHRRPPRIVRRRLRHISLPALLCCALPSLALGGGESAVLRLGARGRRSSPRRRGGRAAPLGRRRDTTLLRRGVRWVGCCLSTSPPAASDPLSPQSFARLRAGRLRGLGAQRPAQGCTPRSRWLKAGAAASGVAECAALCAGGSSATSHAAAYSSDDGSGGGNDLAADRREGGGWGSLL